MRDTQPPFHPEETDVRLKLALLLTSSVSLALLAGAAKFPKFVVNLL